MSEARPSCIRPALHATISGTVQPIYFLFFSSLPLLCFGTTIVRTSLEEAVAQAQWIVEGDVVRNWCEWDQGHQFIWTHTEISVRSHWKGSGGRTITVSEPGGVVGGIGMAAAGMVRYTPGEHVVAFLYRTPVGFIRTVGVTQGKLQIDTRGLVHFTPAAAEMTPVPGSGAMDTPMDELEGRTLDEVHSRILRLAAGHRGAARVEVIPKEGRW